jgi:nitrogenase molybdenum-iron protein beta chain
LTQELVLLPNTTAARADSGNLDRTGDALRVLDHNELFGLEEYVEQHAAKREMEAAPSDEAVEETLAWSRGWEYREKVFAREALVVNPLKACQPLGAVLAGLGFAGTLPYVHGSQGCVAYFRSHLSRHFKEPVPAVSSSMTEDAAVFGGQANLIEGVENARALYKPDMIAVSTTCMAEVIGDDLAMFLATAEQKGALPVGFPAPYANTPSFVGSHLTGYDSMLFSILSLLTKDTFAYPGGGPSGDQAGGSASDRTVGSRPRINVLPGFDPYVGNVREMRRLLGDLGVDVTVLGDHSDTLDSPADGEYRLFPGGTPLAEVAAAPGAVASLPLQAFSTRRSCKLIQDTWGQQVLDVAPPIGIRNTDAMLMAVAEATGTDIPTKVTAERGRVIDAITDSHPYVHGKRVALAGDPDLVLGLLSFLLELGAEPTHILCTSGDAEFERAAYDLLSASPYGAGAKVWAGKDAWHLRSLVLTEPVDLIIGPSHLKGVAREADVPLVRFGFPVFDRHHLHRYPIVGYAGALNLLTWIVNAVLEELDRKAPDFGLDIVR